MMTSSFKQILFVICLIFCGDVFAKIPKISKEYKRAICSKKLTTVTQKGNKTIRLNESLDCEGRANRLGIDPRACELCVIKSEKSESKKQTSNPSNGDTTTDDNGGDEEEGGSASNGGSSSGGSKPDKDGKPNNGHGNDKDKNDDSNPGKSNDPADNTDDDGSKENGNGKSNK
ncbi:hypothetical protein K2X05_07865 [bacterium]|nr:hypothetical protein [bacterium]